MRLSQYPLTLCLLFFAGCGIPPLDTTYVSTVPAGPQSFAVAQRAARACVDVTDEEKTRDRFARAGFGVVVDEVTLRGGRTVERTTITAPDDAITVLYFGHRCYIGLENMTLEQSVQLAQIWVNAYDAESNASFGDGLSEHVAGAWRRFYVEPKRIPDKAEFYHRIYIAAYKTWPQGPYDPQGHVAYEIANFPNKPGAAISLSRAIDCNPMHSTGPRSGVFLSCENPEFGPK